MLDFFTRKIVSWCMRRTLHVEIAVDALRMATERRRPTPGLIHQLRARHPVRRRGLPISPGLRWRHTLNEPQGRLLGPHPHGGFLHTLKTERVHNRVYATRDQARRDLFQYIGGFYNPRRLHSALGHISRAEAERRAA